MGVQRFQNNPTTTLAAGTPASGAGSTAITVASAALFPSTLTNGDWFVVTLQVLVAGLVTAQEIVKVTAVSGVNWTVVRAQEGTAALPWVTGNTVALLITAGGLGQFLQSGNLYPITAAETSAGLTVVNFKIAPHPINVLRFGLVPNSTGAKANNTALMVALCNPSVTGPTGHMYFPNTTGADTYYFASAPIQLRDGIHLDLNECIINFSGTFSASLNTFGFFTMIRDVKIENGSIQVNYDGTGGVNNGAAIRYGSRSGYGFGTYTNGIFDQDDLVANGLPLMGNIVFRNLRISTNNPAVQIIYGFGGIRNMVSENLWLDGGGVAPFNAFYYEFGWSSTNGAPGTESSWSSSHMTASHFRNIVISNMATGGASTGLTFNGAYGCTVEDINVQNVDIGLSFGAGESFFYRTWALDGTTQRTMNLRNIRVGNCGIGVVLGGAGSASSSYLNAVIAALSTPARYQAQTDFLNYVMDGFELGVSNVGIIATGTQISIVNGACNGGGINLGAEAIHTRMENVQVVDASGIGIRYDSPVAIWSPPRPVFTAIKNCKITGSTGVGVALGNCQSALIEDNQIGNNLLYDIVAETTQTNAVNLQTTSFGVKCRNNFCSVSSGNVAYQNINTTLDAMNSIENERNLAGLLAGSGVNGGGGVWITDFQSPSAQVLTTSGTIVSNNLKTTRLAPAGAVTGVIMQAGQNSAETRILINESANVITFAAAGTSRVAGGAGISIAATAKLTLVWDSSTSLWY